MSKVAEVADLCDHTFEAAQRCLQAGALDDFRHFAEQHRYLAEFYYHLRNGGMVQ